MSLEERDPETGLRVVHVKNIRFEVGAHDRWRPPPWHPESGDGPDPGELGGPDMRGPLPPTLPGGASAACPKSDEA